MGIGARASRLRRLVPALSSRSSARAWQLPAGSRRADSRPALAAAVGDTLLPGTALFAFADSREETMCRLWVQNTTAAIVKTAMRGPRRTGLAGVGCRSGRRVIRRSFRSALDALMKENLACRLSRCSSQPSRCLVTGAGLGAGRLAAMLVGLLADEVGEVTLEVVSSRQGGVGDR